MGMEIDEIAQHLKEVDAVVQGHVRGLWGHKKPFGTRWDTFTGFRNDNPLKILTRHIDFPSGQSSNDDNDYSRYFRLISEVGRRQLEVLFDEDTVTVTAEMEDWKNARINFTQTPEGDIAKLRASDLGRMILVDTELAKYGFPGQMTQQQAKMVLETVEAIPAPTSQML
jgi:hypothetical protein